MTSEWIETLRMLADDSNEFDHQGGKVVFVRRGKEIDLDLRDRPGVGLCVLRDINGLRDYVPIATYIQRDLLELHRLAQQVQKTLDKLAQKRPARFVDGPASFENAATVEESNGAIENLRLLLIDTEPGVTNLIQLMAPAGHGKTVLLEEIAHDSSKQYSPDPHPYPLVLLVDLLGRFVGNIDDAIAGAINNTYSFPSLTQRDVVVAMRYHWLTLALDGFDELVARIGPKDAFLRISDLLDQVNGAGSLIISARESFFELYRISISIRSYLQPKRGSFKTSVVRLRPWTIKQGVQVFQQLDSVNPEQELQQLLEAFADDLIAFQPFFLTRLAELWRKGERFVDGRGGGHGGRIRYVIDKLLEREAHDKWRDSKGNPLLSKEDHEHMLCTVAEEMFRTGAFFLRTDEVRLAAQIALDERNVPTATASDAMERFPTHAFLHHTERGYRFTHDKFLHFFLGVRLSELAVRDIEEFLICIKDKEIAPEVIEWIVSCLPVAHGARIEIVQRIAETVRPDADQEQRTNLGALLPRILQDIECNRVVAFKGIIFPGDVLKGLRLKGIIFSKCSFHSVDMSGTSLVGCEFSRCEFDSIVISDTTVLSDSHFDHCSMGSLHLGDRERTFYSPSEISERVILLGATLNAGDVIPIRVLADEVPADIIEVVERLVKASHKGWDICVEEFVDRWGKMGQKVIDVALKQEILRNWHREVGGPKRHFVRFQVDRNLVLESLRNATVEPAIARFWRSFSKQ